VGGIGITIDSSINGSAALTKADLGEQGKKFPGGDLGALYLKNKVGNNI